MRHFSSSKRTRPTSGGPRSPTLGKPKGYKLDGIIDTVPTVRATRYDTNDPAAELRPATKSVAHYGPKGLLGTLLVGRSWKVVNVLTFAMVEGRRR